MRNLLGFEEMKVLINSSYQILLKLMFSYKKFLNDIERLQMCALRFLCNEMIVTPYDALLNKSGLVTFVLNYTILTYALYESNSLTWGE